MNASPQDSRATFMASLRTLPQPVRWAVLGAVSVGTGGAIVGLMVGLHAYVWTAPVAMVELGLPATIVGGVVGFAFGSVVAAADRISRSRLRPQKTRQPERSPS